MKKLRITVNNQSYSVTVEEVNESAFHAVEPQSVSRPVVSRSSIPLPTKQSAASAANGGNNITAPMPGLILSINANVGDTVKNGDIVLVLEAMKMENEIQAKKGGIIKEITVKEGQTVSAGEVLVIIE